jgi:hypothetical protein
MLAQPPPPKNEKPGASHGTGQISENQVNFTTARRRTVRESGQALSQRQRNVIAFCVRHAGLLDAPEVKTLNHIVNGFERRRSWRELRGDGPGDVVFETLADEHEARLNHQLDRRLDDILLKIEQRRRQP